MEKNDIANQTKFLSIIHRHKQKESFLEVFQKLCPLQQHTCPPDITRCQRVAKGPQKSYFSCTCIQTLYYLSGNCPFALNCCGPSPQVIISCHLIIVLKHLSSHFSPMSTNILPLVTQSEFSHPSHSSLVLSIFLFPFILSTAIISVFQMVSLCLF